MGRVCRASVITTHRSHRKDGRKRGYRRSSGLARREASREPRKATLGHRRCCAERVLPVRPSAPRGEPEFGRSGPRLRSKCGRNRGAVWSNVGQMLSEFARARKKHRTKFGRDRVKIRTNAGPAPPPQDTELGPGTPPTRRCSRSNPQGQNRSAARAAQVWPKSLQTFGAAS